MALLTELKFNWKTAVRKIGMVGKNKNKKKTHHHYLPHATGGAGIMRACSCTLDRLREGGWCSRLNNNLTEKMLREKFEGKK